MARTTKWANINVANASSDIEEGATSLARKISAPWREANVRQRGDAFEQPVPPHDCKKTVHKDPTTGMRVEWRH